MNLITLELLKALFFICVVTSVKVNPISKLHSTMATRRNATEITLNNTLNYNDLITLSKTQEAKDYVENLSATSSLTIATTASIKAINYDEMTTTTKQDSLKDNDNGKRHELKQQQQQHHINYQLYNHDDPTTIKFNNDNLNSNKLKTFSQDVVKENILQTTTTTTTTFNDNKHIKDFKNIDNDERQLDEDDDVVNIKDNADNLHEQHQRKFNTPSAFVGQLPQLQQQLNQRQQQQPFLPQEYHHLSDYRLFFNPERHTEFYLHTLSSPLFGSTKEAEEEAAAYSNDNDDDVGDAEAFDYDSYNKDNDSDVVAVDVTTIQMTNSTNPRVLNVVTDTIGAAFGVVTRPVATIHGIRIEEIELYNGLSLRQSRFNPFNPCRILIHGWLGSFNAGIYNTLVPEYLKLDQENKSYNIITVDWGKGAISDYITASYRVKPVGKVVAKFIDFLHRESGIPFEKIQVIGFSMGAHIAGIAGKYVQAGRLPVIYGLDPALPLFRYENQNERLDRNDAEYVEVVHTSAGSYGYDRPLGHVDFYINFGYNQPGCFFNECSHFRAFQVFAQTLQNEVLMGQECAQDLWMDLIKYKSCLKETGFKLDINAEGLNKSMMALRRGVYYVKTSTQPPYAVT